MKRKAKAPPPVDVGQDIGGATASAAGGASADQPKPKPVLKHDQEGKSLPIGWRMTYSRSRDRPYYYNVNNKEDTKTWNRPELPDMTSETVSAPQVGEQLAPEDSRAAVAAVAAVAAEKDPYEEWVSSERTKQREEGSRREHDKIKQMQQLLQFKDKTYTLPSGWKIKTDRTQNTDTLFIKVDDSGNEISLDDDGEQIIITDPFDSRITGIIKPPVTSGRPSIVTDGVNKLTRLLPQGQAAAAATTTVAPTVQTTSANPQNPLDSLLGESQGGGRKKKKSKRKSSKKHKSKKHKSKKRKYKRSKKYKKRSKK